MARKLVVELVGDSSSLDRALGRAQGSSSKLGGSFGKLGKAGLVAGGAAGVGALIYTLKTGIGEFMQSQKVAAQTTAVIKSTGGAANITAKEVSGLAESLMRKSGVDDEAIASGENMLLTFTRIRNEVGAGNDIFDQATAATLDLSVAMGKDMSSSAILVGKALNDPIKGLTAMSRVGIQFTEGQKESIKQMVEMGDTIGAQKIILKELNKEFGGSAEALGKTLPGQINIVKERFNNWAGEMVSKTIPTIQNMIGWLRDHWPEIQAKFQAMWDAVEPALIAFGELIETVGGLVEKHWGTIGPIVEDIGDIVKKQFAIITDILNVFTALLRGDWTAAWNALKSLVANVIDSIKAKIALFRDTIGVAATKAGENIKNAVIAGVTGVANAVWDIVNNIGSLITEKVAEIKNWGANVGTNIKSGVTNAITGVASSVWDVILNIRDRFTEKADEVAGWGRSLGASLKGGLLEGVEKIAGSFKKVWHWLDKVIGGIKWLIDKIPSIPDLPSLPDITPGFGGSEVGKSPFVGGIKSGLWDDVELGRRMGLTLSSGLRPGDPGDHGSGRAIDMAGTPTAMKRFALAEMLRGTKDVIYGGLSFWQDNGRIVSNWAGNEALRADHYDHVHASIFDKGGWSFLKPGWNLMGNFTGRPEPMWTAGRGGAADMGATYVFNFPNYYGDKRELAQTVRVEFEKMRRGGAAV